MLFTGTSLNPWVAGTTFTVETRSAQSGRLPVSRPRMSCDCWRSLANNSQESKGGGAVGCRVDRTGCDADRWEMEEIAGFDSAHCCIQQLWWHVRAVTRNGRTQRGRGRVWVRLRLLGSPTYLSSFSGSILLLCFSDDQGSLSSDEEERMSAADSSVDDDSDNEVRQRYLAFRRDQQS